jgi:uncharacterized protein
MTTAAERPTRTYPRHQVRRIKERASYDRETAYAILDSAFIAHVGFCVDAQPFVIPMLYARDGDAILLHGSIASRLIQRIGSGIEACVSVTIVDALVLARSQFHHSANYRSVVAFGRASIIENGDAKLAALSHFVDAMLPGRAAEARAPDRNELAATHVLRLEIADITAKIRSGGPKDDSADADLAVWSGLLPTSLTYGAPEPAEDCAHGVSVPDSVTGLLSRQTS